MAKKNLTKKFRLSSDEMEIIKQKSETVNMTISKYIRTMALDGKILYLKVPEYQDTIKELHRIGGLINQIARRLNETDSFYYDDMQNIKEEHEKLCHMLNQYLSTLTLKEL